MPKELNSAEELLYPVIDCSRFQIVILVESH